MISSPVYCPRMVGRRKQLAFLDERANAAQQGQGSLVLVEGEAGSGKTRLISEASARFQECGLRRFEGQCFEFVQSPFGPFVAILRELLTSETTWSSGAGGRAAVARFLPELEPALSAQDAETDKLRQFEALAQTFIDAARSAPTALILEDLHWADTATIEFLLYLARFVRKARLYIVCTYRSEVPPAHPLRMTIARLEREPMVWRMELEPLSDDEMQTLIMETVRERSALSPEVASLVRRRSEGNPLFAEELIRSAITSTKKRERDMPRSLRDAVAERLRQLTDFERSFIVTAAAIGGPFTPEFLARISAVPIRTILSALRHSIDLQLIKENRDQDTVEFRHALTREATYTELLAAEARPLHRRIAEVLEAESDAASRIAELAYQWWSAGDREKAVTYNEQAGDAAEALCASADAAIFYERCIESIESDDPRRASLLRKLAIALQRSGMGARAQYYYDLAIAAFRARSNYTEAARSLLNLAQLYWTLGDPDRHVSATEQALELVRKQPDDPVWFPARVQMAWGQAFGLCRPLEALRLLKEAETNIDQTLPAERIRLYECRALTHIISGYSNQAIHDAQQAVSIAQGAGLVDHALRCWANVGYMASQAGYKSIATEAFHRAATIINNDRPAGWPVPLTFALRAQALFLWGELAEAQEMVEQALSAIIDVRTIDILVGRVAMQIGVRVDDRSLVERCADEELIQYAFESGNLLVGDVACAFSEYYIFTGNTDKARTMLSRGLGAVHSVPMPGVCDSMFMLIAEYCDEQEVVRARSVVAQMCEALTAPSAPAFLLLIDAWLAKRFGALGKSQDLAMRAADAFASLGWPLHQAKGLELAGEMSRALEIYRAAGDVVDANRLENVVKPANRRGRRKDELSAREHEIAALVVVGKSNRDIARELFLSERTIESHVSSILGKVGASSRHDLAACLSARQDPKQRAAK